MGASPAWRVRFAGQILDGFSEAQVREAIGQRFKADVATLDKLFSGAWVTLKRNLSREQAVAFQQAMAGLGAETELELEALESDPVAAASVSTPLDFSGHEGASRSPGWRAKWHYRVDTFMAKGGANIFKALLLVSVGAFALIALLRGVLFWLLPAETLQYDDLGFWGNVYITFLQVTDPGNMAQDILSSPGYKFFAVIAGLTGVILLSALIAFITTALDQKIHEMKRGRSKVIEAGHTLILGWNEQRIIEIIRELVMANESEKDAAVVILADEDKEVMDDALRTRITDSLSTRLITRSGKPSIMSNLDMVSIEQCKSIVVLSACEESASASEKAVSDARVIQTILASANRLRGQDIPIVAEIYNQTHRDIVLQSFSNQVVTVSSSEALAKLLVQTSRSVGLSVVYNEILSFDGCEMYFHGDNWGGARFHELLYRFPDGVPMGVRQADGTVMLRPDWDYRMRSDDEILILADDDSTIEFRDAPVAVPDPQPTPDKRLAQQVERELIIGWTEKAPIIINEYADYVIDGSEIDVLVKSPSEQVRAEIKALAESLDGIRLKLIDRDPLNREHLLGLDPFSYNNIIILAEGAEGGDLNEVDSENIVTLLLLRSLFAEHGKDAGETKLITEVLDSQNYALVHSAGVKDVIISNRLVSMMMAQLSEGPAIRHVYDDLFSEDGSEIYLKPLSLYYDRFPVEASFADLLEVARNRDEICLGIKIKAQEQDTQANCGVKLIPEKNTRFSLSAEDSLVVLAEDEL